MWVRSGASSWDVAVPSSDASECAAPVEAPRGVSPADEQTLLTELDIWSDRWLSLTKLRAKSPEAPLALEKMKWCLLQSRWCRHYADWVRVGRVCEAQRFLDQASQSLYAFNVLCGLRKEANPAALACFLANRTLLSVALLETLQSLGPSCAAGPLDPVLAQLEQLDTGVDHADQGMSMLNALPRHWTMTGIGIEARWNPDNLREKLRIACTAPSFTARPPSSPGHPASGGPPQPDHH